MFISSRSYSHLKITYNPQQLKVNYDTMTKSALSFLKMRAVNFSKPIAECEWKMKFNRAYQVDTCRTEKRCN